MSNLSGLLVDLDGVLYIEDQPIPGAVATVNWLRRNRYPLRFLTNTTMKSKDTLIDKLTRMGIQAKPEEMFSTAVVAARWLAEKGISRVQLLLPEDPRRDFAEFTVTTDRPEAVVVGDLRNDFTFDALNDAFLSIRNGATLVALQKNRFWRTAKGLSLDVGPFVAALEYATETEAVLIGKPNRAYFETAINDLGLPASQVGMVGDDVHTDILGAQAVGTKTILVKTGKYPFDADKPFPVQPDWTLESIVDLPELLCS
jgi:HAD superfamily hydrolase (TIGR01458 family)